MRRDEKDPFQTDCSSCRRPARRLPFQPHRHSVAVTPRCETLAEGTGLPGAGELEGPQAPSLALEKRAAAEIQVGKECTFEIRIRNTGQVPAHGVTVRDEIPQKTRSGHLSAPRCRIGWRTAAVGPRDLERRGRSDD